MSLIIDLFQVRLEVALQKMGISSLFPVQVAVWQETIGPGAFERDLCINSPTGSGKTLAYALPIVQMLSTRAVKCIRALVVLPTRDLALQVPPFFMYNNCHFVCAWNNCSVRLKNVGFCFHLFRLRKSLQPLHLQ